MVGRPGQERVLARGTAEDFYPPLGGGSFGDGCYGFAVALPASLAPEDYPFLQVWPEGGTELLQRAEANQGYVDAFSVSHVAGWVRDRFNPTARLTVEVVLPEATVSGSSPQRLPTAGTWR